MSDLLNTMTNAGIISFLTYFKVLMIKMSSVAFVVSNRSNSFPTSLWLVGLTEIDSGTGF